MVRGVFRNLSPPPRPTIHVSEVLEEKRKKEMTHGPWFVSMRGVCHLRGGRGLPRPVQPMIPCCPCLGCLGVCRCHPLSLGCWILGCGVVLLLIALMRSRSSRRKNRGICVRLDCLRDLWSRRSCVMCLRCGSYSSRSLGCRCSRGCPASSAQHTFGVGVIVGVMLMCGVVSLALVAVLVIRLWLPSPWSWLLLL